MALVVKNLPANTGDTRDVGLILGQEDLLEEGDPLQYSYLENPRDGGAWWVAVSGVTQSWTRLK